MTTLIRLADWLNQSSEHVVAVQMENSVRTADLKQRVKKWIGVLSLEDGLRWGVYHTDSFEFMAILFALWQLGKTACVPGDNHSGTVERLSHHVNGFAGIFPDGLSIDGLVDDELPAQWKNLDPSFAAIEIYTSGSTGEPKAITKTIAQLDIEIGVLESLWPSLKNSVVLGTVPHQHFYGMVFRLLWPLCSGRAFERLMCEYSEDIFHHAKYYGVFSLIASPSHLTRMSTTLNWAELSEQCQYVISSAAPLAKLDSEKVSQLLTPVREIYGSSETGAIAWRIQCDKKTDALWQALPQVKLTLKGDNLVASSPYLANHEPLLLPDRVTFYPGKGFELLGRADSIVKVEGKRVSLMEIENRLLSHEWVSQAKALVLSRQRVETAVVVQLNLSGFEQLEKVGRKIFIDRIKECLKGYFDPVVLPRRWRFFDRLPYNAQGKLPMAMLSGLFEKKAVKWPEIEDTVVINNEATIRCLIPKDLIYFDGHFKNNPILPGVAQTYWAEKFGKDLLSISGRFKGIDKLKFLKIIIPNTSLTISLKYNQGDQSLIFTYQSEQGLHSTGRISFGE